MSDLPYHHNWKSAFEVSLGLQIKWFGTWGGDPEWRIEPSRLGSDLICFFYLEKGACDMKINGVVSSITPGEIVVIRGGDIFSATQDFDHPQTSLSACISLNYDESSNVLLQYAYPRIQRLSDSSAYEESFKKVMKVMLSDSHWSSFHVSGAFFQWLGGLNEELNPSRMEADTNVITTDHVLNAQEWIQSRLGAQITIKDWAESCGLNVDYFSRLFKSHTGMSAKAWLVEARLQRAARQLAYPEKTIESVASSSGFNCPFYFSRSFKKRFGLPPIKYRNIRQV